MLASKTAVTELNVMATNNDESTSTDSDDPDPTETTVEEIPLKKKEDGFSWSLLKDPWFIVFCIISLLCTVTHVMKMLFMVRYAQDVGMSDYSAVGYMSICQALELVCTITSGVVASAINIYAGNF